MLLLLLEWHFVTPYASSAALFIPLRIVVRHCCNLAVCDKLMIDVVPSQTGETAALGNF